MKSRAEQEVGADGLCTRALEACRTTGGYTDRGGRDHTGETDTGSREMDNKNCLMFPAPHPEIEEHGDC